MRKGNLVSLVAVLAVTLGSQQALARSNVEIVGSSTVYPFATVVAERFGRSTGGATPKIESTGSGGGIKMFCGGVGEQYPDIANASRRIKSSEFKMCQENGVTDVVEVQIGFDGIVLANSVRGEQLSLSRLDIFLALAKFVPDASGNLILNPNTTWKEVNSTLPAIKIEVLGPPPTSGTRDAFAELAMEGGCLQIPSIVALKSSDKDKFTAVCQGVREDGAYIEAGENDNLIIQKLGANKDAFGVFGYSFLEQNTDVVQGSIIEGVEPEFDTIADKSYSVSRPLYFYIKKAHVDVIPGIQGYVAEFTSEKAWGEEGYLSDRGLIPMPTAMRRAVADQVKRLVPMTGNDL